MKSRNLIILGAAVTFAVLLIVYSLAGQMKKEAVAPSHAIVHYSDLKWTPIMKNTDFAVVSGDPNAAGGLRDTDSLHGRHKGPSALASRG
jgi:hypothetical protein